MGPSTRHKRRVGLAVLCGALVLLPGCTGPSPDPTDACPSDVTAKRTAAGDVRLSWEPVPNATTYPVDRSTGDGSYTRIANVSAPTTTYTDATVPATGQVSYRVRASAPEGEASGCPTVEVAPIPVFPTLASLAAAGLIGLGALALLHRRKRDRD